MFTLHSGSFEIEILISQAAFLKKTSAFDPTEDQMCNSFIATALMRKKQLFHLWRAHVWTAMDTAA